MGKIAQNRRKVIHPFFLWEGEGERAREREREREGDNYNNN